MDELVSIDLFDLIVLCPLLDLPGITDIHQSLAPIPAQLLVVPDIKVSVGFVSLV